MVDIQPIRVELEREEDGRIVAPVPDQQVWWLMAAPKMKRFAESNP
jgi:hypothetical protein